VYVSVHIPEIKWNRIDILPGLKAEVFRGEDW